MLTDIKYPSCNPEIWGGLECTINRVGDSFRDQLLYSGHYTRPDDIERFAALGIRAIRYPVLWERHQPHENSEVDWSWTERQLTNIRAHNIIPIVGLVHHGSGPAFTSLLDTNFPDRLAMYAREVAIKFPWVEYYTPVNEPLTTGRFSGLYGLWYPHHKDEFSFLTMVLNQVKGIVLSMQAIREINPRAKLVQTEDLAKTHSTELLRYQSDFENHRRWLTYDLLCGRVNRNHALWNYFISVGIAESMLTFFLENTCVPDIMGLNYYVTSERYLDERIGEYPSCLAGGNGKHTYVDTEAVRVLKSIGLKELLIEAWDRYGLPMAITEAHLCCTREEQMRWFQEIWEVCCEVKQIGIDLKAVTAWSLLGAYDWNSLLTQCGQHYESGVFDVNDNALRPTAITRQIYSLSKYGRYSHPVLIEKGWWHMDRLKDVQKYSCNGYNHVQQPSPLLIVGDNAQHVNAFTEICNQRAIHYKVLFLHELMITNANKLQKVINQYKPWAVLNLLCHDINASNSALSLMRSAQPTGKLVQLCQQYKIQLVTVSSPTGTEDNQMLYDEATVLESITKTAVQFITAPMHLSAVVMQQILDLLIDGIEGILYVTNEGNVRMDETYQCIALKAFENNSVNPKTAAYLNWKANVVYLNFPYPLTLERAG